MAITASKAVIRHTAPHQIEIPHVAVEVIDRGHEALLELLFGGDTDVGQDGARQLGEEAFGEVEPGAVLGSEGELKPAGGLLGEPSSGLSGDMRGIDQPPLSGPGGMLV